jgi:hypothetical protein
MDELRLPSPEESLLRLKFPDGRLIEIDVTEFDQMLYTAGEDAEQAGTQDQMFSAFQVLFEERYGVKLTWTMFSLINRAKIKVYEDLKKNYSLNFDS